MRIDCDRVTWQASFLPEKSTEKFVMGLFAEQTFQIGDRMSAVQFRIERIEALPSPDFAAATAFRTLSPVCIPYLTSQLSHICPCLRCGA
jgi:CRISPR-associated endoribonuclease Cas6